MPHVTNTLCTQFFLYKFASSVVLYILIYLSVIKPFCSTMKTVILLFLLSLFAHQSLAQYEYFKLVIQWPPTACLTFSCTPLRKPHQNFTLHGIWPSNYSGYEPRACYTTNHLPRIVFTGAMVCVLYYDILSFFSSI
jgi:ribonuclease I